MAKSNKVKYNLKNVMYAPMEVGNDGIPIFSSFRKWPGAVSISLSAQGNISTFYADGIAYYVTSANNGYQGDFTCALIPLQFRTEILNEVLDEIGVRIENANGETKAFALAFEFDGDEFSFRHVLYNCKITRPQISSSTNTDQKSPETDVGTITATPLENGQVLAATTEKTDPTAYDAWYDLVYYNPNPGTFPVIEPLNITSVAGSSSGDTALTVLPAKESGNKYRYKITTTNTLPEYDDDITTGYIDWNGTDDITAATGSIILVVECTADDKARKAGVAIVTAMI